jgi:hypothetical protein
MTTIGSVSVPCVSIAVSAFVAYVRSLCIVRLRACWIRDSLPSTESMFSVVFITESQSTPYFRVILSFVLLFRDLMM